MMIKWFFKLFGSTSLMLLMGCALIWAASYYFVPKLENEYPAPGRLVDVGGYEMHIRCLGKGKPTVIMEADSNEFSVQWANIQPRVAKYSRVCAYDRAGLGWSSRGDKPRTSSHMVEELHTLLKNAGEQGPYVFVGHSFGGLNARLFSHQYPGSVQGMVLVDSAHENQHQQIPELKDVGSKMALLYKVMQMASKIGALAVTPEAIPENGLVGDALDQYRAVLATKDYFKTAEEETRSLSSSLTELQLAELNTLGDMPLVVLSRGMMDPLLGMSDKQLPEYEKRWRGLQQELTHLSSNSRHIHALKSRHFIHLSEPDIVIRAIREVLLQIRKYG